MKRIRDITAKDIILKPKVYDDCPIIWTLTHFDKLKNDFNDCFTELVSVPQSKGNDECVEVARGLCEAMNEFAYLIGCLKIMSVDKYSYRKGCDYEALITSVYLAKDEKELAHKVGRTSETTSHYSYTTKNRDIRYAVYYLSTVYENNPEQFKHLRKYMKNII